MMERINDFISKSLEGFKNFKFDVDIEAKQARSCQLVEAHSALFNEIAVIRKDIQILFYDGKDSSISRIKSKLLETKEVLDKMDIDFELKNYQFDFYFKVDSNIIRKINRLKISHIESLLHFIQNLDSLDKGNKPEDASKVVQQKDTKTDKLKAELGKYGFFELSKVKQLSEPNKQSLIELISTNDLPYSISMFEYLGYLKHLKAEHFNTDRKLFKAVANWFEVDERTVKGNIYVLNEFSNENRTRYTADQKKKTVQKDYEKLK